MAGVRGTPGDKEALFCPGHGLLVGISGEQLAKMSIKACSLC